MFFELNIVSDTSQKPWQKRPHGEDIYYQQWEILSFVDVYGQGQDVG